MNYLLLPLFTVLSLALNARDVTSKAVATDATASTIEVLATNGNQDPGDRIDRMVKRLTEQLKLSDTQQTQIRDIAERYAEERKSLREAGDKEALRGLREKQEDALLAVLTDGQRKEYKMLKAERREKVRERKEERGDRAERMAEELTGRLGLDERQQNQMRDIGQRYAEKRKELRGERDKEALRSLRKEQEAEFFAILSKEQQEEYKKIKAERRDQMRERRGERGGRRGRGGRGQ